MATVPRRPVLVIVAALCTAVLGAPGANATAAAAPGGQDPACTSRATTADPAVRSLAADRSIPIVEAGRRISAQLSAAAVGDRLRTARPDRFGGVWIATDGSDRVMIGSTPGITTTASFTGVAGRCGITAPGMVTVSRTAAELSAAADWLERHVATPDSTVGIDYAANTVRFNTSAAATPAQQVAIGRMPARLRSAVTVGRLAAAPDPLTCSARSCDPPLRGGVEIQRSVSGGSVICSSAFVTRNLAGSAYFLLTAGHCGTVGAVWTSKFASGAPHVIGEMRNRSYGAGGDMAVIRINNPAGWQLPRAAVYVQAGPDTTRDELYPISRVADSVQGMRVCKSGRTTATTCGTVTALGVSVSYNGTIVRNLVQASFCAAEGDSGAAVFAARTAYGILSGSAGSCTTFYQPVRSAASVMKVAVATQ